MAGINNVVIYVRYVIVSNANCAGVTTGSWLRMSVGREASEACP